MAPQTAPKIETIEEKLARLTAENAALTEQLVKSSAPRSLKCKVGAAGGVSVYGIGRFPVTLYQEQWSRVLDFGPEIRKFILANKSTLKTKVAA